MKTFLLTTRLALLGIAASAASLFIAWSGLTLPWYVEVVGHFQYGYAAAAAGALVVAAAMRARKDVRLVCSPSACPCSCSVALVRGAPARHRLRERHAHGRELQRAFRERGRCAARRLPGSREPGPRRRRRARGADEQRAQGEARLASHRVLLRDGRGPGTLLPVSPRAPAPALGRRRARCLARDHRARARATRSGGSSCAACTRRRRFASSPRSTPRRSPTSVAGSPRSRGR